MLPGRKHYESDMTKYGFDGWRGDGEFRWDIVMAHYLFCTEWYDGMGDPLYARMCGMQSYYRPSIVGPDYAELSSTAREIYRDLCARWGHAVPEEYDSIDANDGSN